jgi:hypothetical protein
VGGTNDKARLSVLQRACLQTFSGQAKWKINTSSWATACCEFFDGALEATQGNVKRLVFFHADGGH